MKKSVRLICLILAGLMLLGVAFAVIMALV